MKEITLDLSCDLTDEELAERAQLLSSAMLKYDEVEDRKKEVSKQFAEELGALRVEMTAHSKTLRKKSEIRPTVCIIKMHCPEMGMKRVVRKETGEFVRDEAMSMEERQGNMFDEVEDLKRLYQSGTTDEPEKPSAE